MGRYRPAAVFSASGPGTAAALAALIEKSSPASPCYLPAGVTIDLDASIDIANPNACVIGLGGRERPTTLRAAYAARSTGDVDKISNYMLRFQGATSGSSTTIATGNVLRKGTTSLVVASDIVDAGAWVLVRGDNKNNDEVFANESNLLILEELLYVASASGTAYTLGAPAAVHHGAAAAHESTVQAIIPTSPIITGIRFDGGGTRTAIGLAVSRSYQPTLDGLTFVDFTKAGLWVDCAKDVRKLRNILGEGELNSLVYLRSCQYVDVENVTTSSGGVAGERHNALGMIRGLIELRHRCTGIALRGARLVHGCKGIGLEGTRDVVIEDCVVDDMDFTDLNNTSTEIIRVGGTTGAAQAGAGLNCDTLLLVNDTNTGLDEAHDYSFGLTINGLVLKNCRHPDDKEQAAAMFCDVRGHLVKNLTVINDWFWSSTAPYANGIIGLDALGTIQNLTIRGCRFAIQTINSGALWQIDNCFIGTFDGQSSHLSSFYLRDDGVTSVHFGNLTIESDDGYLILVKSGWKDVSGRSLVVDRLRVQGSGIDWQDCCLYWNTTASEFANGAIGEVVDYTTGGVTYRGVQLATTTAAHDKVAMVWQHPAGGANWVLGASGPRRGVLVDPAVTVAHGARLIPVVGQLYAAVDATLLLESLGQALRSRTATVGPVQISS